MTTTDEQDMIDRLTNNERAFYFLSKEEQDFMRNWPHGVSILASDKEDNPFHAIHNPTFFGGNVYRLNPAPCTPIDLPWEWIDDRYQWAAMDEDGYLWLYTAEPQISAKRWCFEYGGYHYLNDILKIDTTGIDWRTSLTKRPEASE